MSSIARSTFSKAHQERIQEELLRLVRGTLQESATTQNIGTAVPWISQRLRDHRFRDTNEAEVSKDFANLLDKLRAHSQLEAAEYLACQHAGLFRCKLSQRYTLEPHAAVLRALLLLARQPTQVPPRVVRSLRGIFDGRRQRAAQQKRQAGEQVLEKKLLLELELRQVAENSCLRWDEEWAEAGLVAGDGPEDSPEVPLASAGAGFEDTLDDDEYNDRDDDSFEGFGDGFGLKFNFQRRGERNLSHVKEKATARRNTKHEKGCLPRQPWQQVLAQEQQLLERLLPGRTVEKLLAIPVSEQAVVQMALQMLAGHHGELLEVGADCYLRWRTLVSKHAASPALATCLQPLTELGSALHQLRGLVALLEALAVDSSDALRKALIQGLCDKSLASVREVAQFWEMQEAGLFASGLDDGKDVGHVFGLCWQSMALMLRELLAQFAGELHKLEAEACCGGERSDEQLGSPVTLMRLLHQLEPWRRSVLAARHALDNALASLCRALQDEREAIPFTAAEALLSNLASAACSQDLCGSSASENCQPSDWLVPLWCAAARPLLRATEQWGTVGELHDPCGEFAGRRPEGTLIDEVQPKLLLRSVAAAGRHVRSLRGWSQVALAAGHCPPRSSAQELASLRRCLGGASVPDLTTGTSSSSGCKFEFRTWRLQCRKYVPFDASLEARVLGPVRHLAGMASRPLLLRVLQDDEQGLLRHLAALRLVAFLERESAVGPLLARLYKQIRLLGRAGSCSGEELSRFALEMNAALAEGLETTAGVPSGCRAARPLSPLTTLPRSRLAADALHPPWHAAQLCTRHLSLSLGGEKSRHIAKQPSVASPSVDPFAILDRLSLAYRAPAPLDRVLDVKALHGYSLVLVLLARVRSAQSALMEVHSLPLFGFGAQGRRARQVPSLAPLAHSCDLFRAELQHFLTCLEHYLRVDVLQKECLALERRLRLLATEAFDAMAGRSSTRSGLRSHYLQTEESVTDAVDILERVRQFHSEHIERILQASLLVPELTAVLSDLQQLLGMAAHLRGVLEKLLQKLPGFLNAARRESSEDHPVEEKSEEELEDQDEENESQADAENAGSVPRDVEEELLAALEATSGKVYSIQRDFRNGLRYMLQVLNHSVARGAAPQVASLCAQLDFNGFYGQ